MERSGMISPTTGSMSIINVVERNDIHTLLPAGLFTSPSPSFASFDFPCRTNVLSPQL